MKASKAFQDLTRKIQRTKPLSESKKRRGRRDSEATATQRQRILRAYDYTCIQCGSKEEPTIDHVIPLAKGGTSYDDNLQVLCEKCNQAKGDSL